MRGSRPIHDEDPAPVGPPIPQRQLVTEPSRSAHHRRPAREGRRVS
jgi:hypothetical protein